MKTHTASKSNPALSMQEGVLDFIRATLEKPYVARMIIRDSLLNT